MEIKKNLTDSKLKLKNQYSLPMIKDSLELLHNQVDYANSCLLISDKLYNYLHTKYVDNYKCLNGKWYIYCLNSLEDNCVLLLCKIFNNTNNELSLTNLLEKMSSINMQEVLDRKS